jgi:hypothetical protein
MAHHIVKLRFDGGQIQTDPMPVVAARGDTLVWTSDEGDVTVSFDISPFEGDSHFAGKKGKHTTVAKVRLDAKKGHFDCKASIGGKEGTKVYGVDIEP